jgi:sugar phosphate isomerase/epimerase
MVRAQSAGAKGFYMSKPFARRQFLSAVGVSAAAAAMPRASGVTLPLQSGGETESTLPSGNKPRLFVGCCAYSFAKYLESGRMTMEDFILKGVELGVHGVDITTYWLRSTEASYLAGLRRLAYKNGMPFSGAAIRTNMCQPDAAKRAEELGNIKRWVDVTELLGAAHLRVFGGEVPPGASEEQGIQWVAEVIEPACEYAAKKGIILGIESHGGITSKASNIIEIVRRVDSPYAGINLDVSHFNGDPYSQIEACLPYATHAHIHEYYGPRKEPLDLDRIWRMFAQAGYKGYMSAEYEEEEDAMTGVPKLVAKIKTLCQKYSSA